MITFTILLTLAAGIIMLQLWQNHRGEVKPIRIESRTDELAQQKRHRRGR